MTTEREVSPEKKFVPAILPWLVAAGAAVVYFVTLNSWVSLNSLQYVAKVSGWTWQPELNGPAFWLVTYPFRWLPARAIPLALNLFTAICAAVTLALLARSVALLPHDRSRDQRQRERSAFSMLSVPAAWVPPVLAALVCGLQLSFWEDATVASADMFDLLLFAYAVRCMLEYRITDRESWLLRASLTFGVGMTNNWAMVGFFPAFVVALIWIVALMILFSFPTSGNISWPFMVAVLAFLLVYYFAWARRRFTGPKIHTVEAEMTDIEKEFEHAAEELAGA